MYYNHNLDFLASAAMMAGQFTKARESADMLVANVLPAVDQMAMIEPFGAKTLFVLLRFSRWDDVLKLPAPNPQHALLTMLSHFGRGVAQAARGNAADAAVAVGFALEQMHQNLLDLQRVVTEWSSAEAGGKSD